MARPLRVNIADGWYHVMGRGTERRDIFVDQRDREHFLELLSGMRERFRVLLHAYAQMDSHYHVIVQTPEANLSQAMQWLQLSHSAWYNARHDRVGPLFQGRFKSIPVQDSAWAYELSLYVHLNPLRIRDLGLDRRGRRAEALGWKRPSREQVAERIRRLRQYRWSSYGAYAGYCEAPEWLSVEPLLARASCEEMQQHRCYRRDVRDRLRNGAKESMIERLREGVAIGATSFVKHVKDLADGGSRETSGKRELRRRVSFEEVLRAVALVKGEDWVTFAGQRGDWGKPLVMTLARRYCAMTLREIGERVNGMDYAAVSIALKRFAVKLRRDATLRQRLTEAVSLLIVET